MQYAALIYKDEAIPVDMGPMIQAYGAFNQELVASGSFCRRRRASSGGNIDQRARSRRQDGGNRRPPRRN